MSDVAQMMADRGMNRPRVSDHEIHRLMAGVRFVSGALGINHDGEAVFEATAYAENGIALATVTRAYPDDVSPEKATLQVEREALEIARRELVRLETWRLQCMLDQPLDRFSLIVELRRLRYLLRRDAARRRDAKCERFAGNGSSPGR